MSWLFWSVFVVGVAVAFSNKLYTIYYEMKFCETNLFFLFVMLGIIALIAAVLAVISMIWEN